MNFMQKIMQVLRVDGISFMLTLGLALTLHFGGLIWDPLVSHQPDLSSGLFICAVLLLLLQPFRRQAAQRFWRSVWLNSLKISLSLLLLQHMALIGIWDNCGWLLNCIAGHHWAPKCRLLLSMLLFSYAVYRWLSRQRAEAFIPMPATVPEHFCPYCSGLGADQQLSNFNENVLDSFLPDMLLS